MKNHGQRAGFAPLTDQPRMPRDCMEHPMASELGLLHLIKLFRARMQSQPTSRRDIVIDGGFHLGCFSKKLVDTIQDVHCYGFEPNPSLCKAWRESDSTDHISLACAALYSKNGDQLLHMSDDYPATNSLLPRPAAVGRNPYYPAKANFQHTLSTKTITVDSFCKENNIESIFLLKLDLQGGELKALEGASQMLASRRVGLIYSEGVFVEKYEGQPLLLDIWNFLLTFNFRLHSFHDIKTGDYDNCKCPIRGFQLNQCDALFVSPILTMLYD